MPFSNRVFCRDLESPSLSELLVWMRQQGYEARISDARPPGDLLSSFWDRVELQIRQIGQEGQEGTTVVLECFRGDAAGMDGLTDALSDFATDVRELSDTSQRARVLEHLAIVRSLIVIEFSPFESSDRGEEIGDAILALFVERAGGLGQRDGVGFLDEDADVILSLG
jgi:hypothetical protein